MIGQENSDSQFENEWKEVFGGASQTPPDAVWNEIDRKLAYAELSVYKTKATYYRWAVAAILLLAASLGTLQYLYFQQGPDYRLAINVDKPAPMEEAVSIRIPDSADERMTALAFGDQGRDKQDIQAAMFVASEQEQEEEVNDRGHSREIFEELSLTKLMPEISIAANYVGEAIVFTTRIPFRAKTKSGCG